MVLGIAFLLLVSMVITTMLTGLTGMVTHAASISGPLAQAINFVVSFVVITLLFAMIFKVLPDAQVKWRDVWIGAIGTALLFTAGKYLISFYLGRESTSSSYGAAGSVIVILLWVYYSSLILFFGAEFTQVYARKTGSKIAPSPHAISVTEEQRAEEGIPHQDKAPAGAVPAYAYAQDAAQAPLASGNDGNGFTPRRSLSWVALGAGFVGGWLAHRKVAIRTERSR
jgi:membrane protein